MTKSNICGKDIDIGFSKLTTNNFKILSKFTCGNSYIDKYFTKKAISDKQTTTYFYYNKNDLDVIALVSINCSGIVDLSNPTFKDMIPAIEISYFATNEKYQKLPYSENKYDRTLSQQILSWCITYIKEIPCSYCAAAMVILHSVPDAVNFYSNAGFKSFLEFMEEKNIPSLEGCTPMFLNLI